MELFTAIALLCQVHTSTGTVQTIQAQQQVCQKALIECVDAYPYRYESDRVKLAACVKSAAK